MTYLFTHNDLDGVGCAVIARLGIPQPLSITYCSYGSVDHEICDLLDKLTVPAEIYISDISVKEETAQRLDHYCAHIEGSRVLLFDHHPIDVSRPWMTVDTSPTALRRAKVDVIVPDPMEYGAALGQFAGVRGLPAPELPDTLFKKKN